MTKHTPIRPERKTEPSSSRSLLERAGSAFGLEDFAPSSVPGDLPEPTPKSKSPMAQPEPGPSSAQSVPADLPPEPRLQLCGPRYEVDREALRESGLIVPEDPVTGLLEEFRIIKREVLADARASSDVNARRVLISSPLPGEGKTFCVANLAIALSAERDVEVLLIDADVNNPSISQRFGIADAPGFMDALTGGDQRPEKLAIETDIERLFIMPAGTSSMRDSDLFASARTGEVLDRLTQGAPNRFVLFDTPPALAASPAAELAAFVGQALLVVRADETSRAAIEDARQLLAACADLKLLLNAVQFSPSGRRFGGYGATEGV
ncbi:MAG: AAA family ATPase [Pseudomonadota bacterium]